MFFALVYVFALYMNYYTAVQECLGQAPRVGLPLEPRFGALLFFPLLATSLLWSFRLELSDSPLALFVAAVRSPAAYKAAQCCWTSFQLFAVFTLPCFVLKMATVCESP
jgi:hypothetical protein